jgi:ribonuclease HI
MEDSEIPRGVTTMDGHGVHVHFDGACQPPKGPGVATFGFTVEGEGLDFEDCGLATRPYSERSTNNVAEYVAAIRALEWLYEQGYAGVVIASGDSQLVIRQMLGEYRVESEHLKAYHEWLEKLAGQFASVQWVWIPREQNTRADALSKLALEEARPVARKLRARGEAATAAADDSDDESESEPGD